MLNASNAHLKPSYYDNLNVKYIIIMIKNHFKYKITLSIA